MLPAQAGHVLNDGFVAKPFSHHIWQEVLSGYVTADGRVDFVRLRGNPKRLNQYLEQLARVSPDSQPDYFPGYHAKLAYWINAHNALALRLVLDAYPVATLDALPGFYRNNRYHLGGKPFSLWEIRDRLAREFFLRPQAFFALSSLTESAPRLLNQAYSADKPVLEKQIEAMAREFLSDPDHVVVIDPKPGECATVELDPLIKQFERPIRRFENAKGSLFPSANHSVLDFVMRYIHPDAHGLLFEDCGHPVKYMRADNRLRRL